MDMQIRQEQRRDEAIGGAISLMQTDFCDQELKHRDDYIISIQAIEKINRLFEETIMIGSTIFPAKKLIKRAISRFSVTHLDDFNMHLFNFRNGKLVFAMFYSI